MQPAGWLDNEPDEVADPEASKPEDWDEEEDGEWEAPLVPNPKVPHTIYRPYTHQQKILPSQFTTADTHPIEQSRVLLLLIFCDLFKLRNVAVRGGPRVRRVGAPLQGQPQLQGQVVRAPHRQPRVQGRLGPAQDP